jgi:hypothetical protein
VLETSRPQLSFPVSGSFSAHGGSWLFVDEEAEGVAEFLLDNFARIFAFKSPMERGGGPPLNGGSGKFVLFRGSGDFFLLDYPYTLY